MLTHSLATPSQVEKLSVVNKSLVRVYLKGSPPNTPSRYFFAIGSVDSFERHLESAQKELGFPLEYWIPVSYVQETNIRS